MKHNRNEHHVRVNDQIRHPQVRLINADGTQAGVVDISVARVAAQRAGLDLVEVGSDAQPPVVKIADYGKLLYEQSVKQRQARRAAHQPELKEIKFRLRIDDHDFETKCAHIRRFVESGHKVKVTAMMRGREIGRPKFALELLERVAGTLTDVAKVDTAATHAGRDAHMVLAPKSPRR